MEGDSSVRLHNGQRVLVDMHLNLIALKLAKPVEQVVVFLYQIL